MNTTTPDPRLDRLCQLLPAIYRMRDADQQQALQAWLRVVAEQVNVVEDDIARLYENWFIETADDWAVSYLADLIGYRPVSEAGPPADETSAEGRALNRVLIPRREVANTIRYRRRKGTLAVLELLANDVAGWPARAVEFFKLLGWNQNVNHLHLQRARTVDVRHGDDLDLLGGPFDPLAHTVDVRRIDSHRAIGRHNIPSVGVFVWRLKPYSVTRCRAHCVEQLRANCYTFSVLGQDQPMFIKPEPETEPTHIAEELNVPAPIRRRAFARNPSAFYGPDKSFVIWTEGWGKLPAGQPVPVEAIIPADLTDWHYVPPPNHIAVDPVLGRFVFPADQQHLPRKGVRVSYHYAFSADIGGGEYERPILDPSPRPVTTPDPRDAAKEITRTVEPVFYRVGANQPFQLLGDALKKWTDDQPWDAVIELADSSVFAEAVAIDLRAERTLQLRAADGARPVLRFLDRQDDLPDALTVTMDRGSRLTLDGLLVTGRGVRIHGPERETPGDPRAPICGSHVVLRHCTLVPGWGLECHCDPVRPEEASLELFSLRAALHLEHSIVGSIRIQEDAVTDDPIPVEISDSIVDATDSASLALGAPGDGPAHAVLTIRRSTVFGIVNVHAVALAENSIFTNCLQVARRQLGCMRFCYVPYGCRTPRRYHCQPDWAAQTIVETLRAEAAVQGATAPTAAQLLAAQTLERQRVQPQFGSVRYGTPTYAQLADTCLDEIRRGADDESEVGVFHDLFQPQREANLRARLEEFTPAGMDVGILHAT